MNTNLLTNYFIAILFCFSFNKNCFSVNILKGDKFSGIPDTSITLKKITTTERTYSGKIDDKYEITIYLKFFSLSDVNTAVYSVKGFYYYNSVKKKIPLVGIYDNNVGLTLYYFTSKEKEDTLLNFKLSGKGANFWDELEVYENMVGFSEKFIIQSKEKGNWQKGTKTYQVKINDGVNFYTTDECLHVYSNNILKIIDLGKTSVTQNGFELINFSKDSSHTKVLLKFSFMSKSYVLGMCGAGEETGYEILYFDKEYRLIQNDVLYIGSCLDSIDYEEEKTNSPDEKKFVITKYQGEKAITTTAIVNEKKITIVRIE
ncbi:MAG TPA: hypothetical protein VKG26_06320 [Bacteroidia bacterium]|nr:hypothetical protein [Bacteroidia bacterium]